jgi:hypothetical protein
MGASPSKPASTSAQHLNEKRVESVTESLAALNVQSREKEGKPLSSDGTIKLENLKQWEEEIAEVRILVASS